LTIFRLTFVELRYLVREGSRFARKRLPQLVESPKSWLTSAVQVNQGAWGDWETEKSVRWPSFGMPGEIEMRAGRAMTHETRRRDTGGVGGVRAYGDDGGTGGDGGTRGRACMNGGEGVPGVLGIARIRTSNQRFALCFGGRSGGEVPAITVSGRRRERRFNQAFRRAILHFERGTI